MSRKGAQKYTPELCDQLEAMFADGSSITKVAAVKLGISRDTYYEWKEKYPEFKVAAEHAESIAEACLEDIGMDGVKGKIDKFSAPMLQFLMKNRFKKTYGEKAPPPATRSPLEEAAELDDN